jgi:hypothetical protein
MYKLKNVITTTTSSSRLYKNPLGDNWGTYLPDQPPKSLNEKVTPKELYVYSDETIRPGDPIIYTDNSFHYGVTSFYEPNRSEDKELSKPWKKIIITTDTKYDLPRPSDKSLELFTKHNGLVHVMVPYTEKTAIGMTDCGRGRKFSSLELEVNLDGKVFFTPPKMNWDYSEVSELLDTLFSDCGPYDSFYKDYKNIEDWKNKHLRRNQCED